MLPGIMNWYNGPQYQATHTLSQRTANTNHRCSKTRIINTVVDVFMKGSVLFSTLLQPFFFKFNLHPLQSDTFLLPQQHYGTKSTVYF